MSAAGCRCAPTPMPMRSIRSLVPPVGVAGLAELGEPSASGALFSRAIDREGTPVVRVRLLLLVLSTDACDGEAAV